MYDEIEASNKRYFDRDASNGTRLCATDENENGAPFLSPPLRPFIRLVSSKGQKLQRHVRIQNHQKYYEKIGSTKLSRNKNSADICAKNKIIDAILQAAANVERARATENRFSIIANNTWEKCSRATDFS